MRVEFHPATVDDVKEAASFYGRIRPDLKEAFQSEVDAAIARIEQQPNLFPLVEDSIRRCVVRRFPYSVLFRLVDAECARILVIRHHRRDPRYGMTRA